MTGSPSPNHQIIVQLLQRNLTHYSQANNTPFGHTIHGANLGYHGTNAASISILNGTYNYHLDELSPETRQYIHALQYHPSVRQGL